MHKTTDEKPFVAICRSSGTNEINDVYVGTYEDVLKKAGKYWSQCDLNFDETRKDPFYVDPASGYSDDVHTHFVSGKVRSVMHAGGEGPCVDILRSK